MKATIAPDTLTPIRIVRYESTVLGVPATTAHIYTDHQPEGTN